VLKPELKSHKTTLHFRFSVDWYQGVFFFLFNMKNKPSVPHLIGMQLHNCKQLLSFALVQCCLGAHNNILPAGTSTILEKYKISVTLF